MYLMSVIPHRHGFLINYAISFPSLYSLGIVCSKKCTLFCSVSVSMYMYVFSFIFMVAQRNCPILRPWANTSYTEILTFRLQQCGCTTNTANIYKHSQSAFCYQHIILILILYYELKNMFSLCSVPKVFNVTGIEKLSHGECSCIEKPWSA